MSLEFDGTNWGDYGDLDTFLDGRTNLSMFLWWYTVSDPTAALVMCGNQNLTSESAEGVTLWIDNSDAGKTDVFRVLGDNINISGDNEGVINGTWQAILFTFEGSVESRLFVDNIEQATSPDANTDATFQGTSGNDFVIGARPAFTSSFRPRNGDRIAELLITDSLLSQGEREALFAGFSPRFINNKIFYAPMQSHTTMDDIVGGASFTEQGAGALKTAEHPPLFMPASPALGIVAGAAPPVTNEGAAMYHHLQNMGAY